MAYDGYRVRPTDAKPMGGPGAVPYPVYVVIDNHKCLVPDSITYNNLFENTQDIVELQNKELDSIPDGDPISKGAMLVSYKKDEGAGVFLLTNKTKRHILAPETMDKFDFDWGKVKEQIKFVIDLIPDGAPII